MKAANVPAEVWVIGGIAAAVVLFVAVKGFGGAAKAATQAIVDTGTGAVAGVAVGVGNAVGLPDTNAAKCEAAIAAGHTLDASVYCPLTRFASYLATGK